MFMHMFSGVWCKNFLSKDDGGSHLYFQNWGDRDKRISEFKRSLVWGQPGLQCKFQDSQDCTEKLCFKNKQQKQNRKAKQNNNNNNKKKTMNFCLKLERFIQLTLLPEDL